jgi:predicted RNase H-like HicB family nuclease
MPTIEVSSKNDAITMRIDRDDWQKSNGYRFHILLISDDAASVSAIVLNLPGIGSCGETEEEAMVNVKEAIQGALEEYKVSGRAIPWKDTSGEVIPRGAIQKWIVVNA